MPSEGIVLGRVGNAGKAVLPNYGAPDLERVHFYSKRLSPGDPLPINVERIKINDGVTSDGELRTAASKLSNGRTAGASGMRAEHIKEWLGAFARRKIQSG